MGQGVRQLLRHAARAGRGGAVRGRDVLFDIDWQGTQQLREKARRRRRQRLHPAAVGRRLEKRLHTRAQDSAEVIRGRMDRASHEMSHWAEYDYIVVNHDLDEAFAEVQSILKAERLKRTRRIGLTEFVAQPAASAREVAGIASRGAASAFLRAHPLALAVEVAGPARLIRAFPAAAAARPATSARRARRARPAACSRSRRAPTVRRRRS